MPQQDATGILRLWMYGKWMWFLKGPSTVAEVHPADPVWPCPETGAEAVERAGKRRGVS